MKIEEYESKHADIKTWYAQGKLNEYEFDKLVDNLFEAWTKRLQIIENKRIINSLTDYIDRLETQESNLLEIYHKQLSE